MSKKNKKDKNLKVTNPLEVAPSEVTNSSDSVKGSEEFNASPEPIAETKKVKTRFFILKFLGKFYSGCNGESKLFSVTTGKTIRVTESAREYLLSNYPSDWEDVEEVVDANN